MSVNMMLNLSVQTDPSSGATDAPQNPTTETDDLRLAHPDKLRLRH